MTRSSHSFDYDVAVLGGGPAGAAAALALARRGRRTVVVERERFPRFHIGESLLSTTHDLLVELGLAERMHAAGFPVKRGALLITADGEVSRDVDFAASREIRRPQTWQVRREDFDKLLLDGARAAGAEVFEGRRVESCAFDAAGASVRLAEGAGAGRELRVRAVVDASGRAGVLARDFGLRRGESRLANVGVFSHFHGVEPRGDGRAGDIVLVSRRDAGWFWFIPVGGGLTSVGVVLPVALYRGLAKGSPEAILRALIDETPAAAARMRAAERAWPVRVEKDYSYSATAYAGDRWLLAGDAGSFLDPVFSTGVSIALESGLEAAAALDRALADGRFAARRFRSFERRQHRRFVFFRRFVLAFYTPWFRDLFFRPDAPPAIFRGVVTVLAGNWRPSLGSRAALAFFFAVVAAQRRLPLVPRLVRRDPEAGFAGADRRRRSPR